MDSHCKNPALYEALNCFCLFTHIYMKEIYPPRNCIGWETISSTKLLHITMHTVSPSSFYVSCYCAGNCVYYFTVALGPAPRYGVRRRRKVVWWGLLLLFTSCFIKPRFVKSGNQTNFYFIFLGSGDAQEFCFLITFNENRNAQWNFVPIKTTQLSIIVRLSLCQLSLIPNNKLQGSQY